MSETSGTSIVTARGRSLTVTSGLLLALIRLAQALLAAVLISRKLRLPLITMRAVGFPDATEMLFCCGPFVMSKWLWGGPGRWHTISQG
ncbi:MAG: hypothetical protein AAGA48_08365 [Myxococcota bacterium]